jgi:glycosyltransferase involved in cell wall biosynthesis
MLNSDWIAYIGPFLFPWGQAGSRRVYGVARSLAEGGYHVVVGCGASEPGELKHLECQDGDARLSYIGLSELPRLGASSTSKLAQLILRQGARTISWLDAQPTKPSHVVLYGGYAQYMFRLLPWCRRNRVPLIVDVVEWYDPRHMQGGFFGPFHISTKIALRVQFPKSDGIIAISSYLADYYCRRGCPVVRIPPTLDLKHVGVNYHTGALAFKPLTLVYAGTPGKKDLLRNAIRGVEMADPQAKRIRLLILGPTREEVCSLQGSKKLSPFVEVLGRVNQPDVAKIIQESDFSILLRESLRFAQAGFPTKFVESIASGTPVIANITTDLRDYLHDGIEGLICPDHTAEAFAQTLDRALVLTQEERNQMRKAARRQAERSFDYRNYTKSLKAFFEGLRR